MIAATSAAHGRRKSLLKMIFNMHAILLDRDGVINYERADYVKHWQEFQFLPGVLSALRQLATLAIPILMITDQSAIGRGIVAEAMVNTIHHQLRDAVVNAGGRIDAFLSARHPMVGCQCQQPGLLSQAARQFDFALKERCYR